MPENEPRRGRPIRLTKALQEAICQNLSISMPAKLAAECEGVPERTFYEWLERGRRGEEPFARFSAAVTRARASGAKNLTVRALAGAKGSSAAMWFLERRFREHYGASVSIDVEGEIGRPRGKRFVFTKAERPENPS